MFAGSCENPWVAAEERPILPPYPWSLVTAFALGAAGALALPPWSLVPLVIPAFSGLFHLLNKVGSRRAAMVGWSFGLGHFLLGMAWITNSFEVDPDRFGILAVPALLGLSTVLALFPAAACMITVLSTSGRWLRILAFAAAWGLAEMLRGVLLSGFPWNLIGYIWSISEAVLQLTSVVGIYGLSFLTVVLATLPALSLTNTRRKVQRFAPSVVCVLGVIGLWAAGELRLSRSAESRTGIQLRIVQGNIPQRLKWHESERAAILSHYLNLTRTSRAQRTDVIIWPETAVPHRLAEDSSIRSIVAEVLSPDSFLISGSIRARDSAVSDIRNSLLVINSKGEIEASYDKVRLVPFGEFVPFRRLIPLKKLTEGTVDFTPGYAPLTLSLANLPPFRPLICYEAIFPGKFWNAGVNPSWLVNLTNDAWFGSSAGPVQHFQMARVRAIENGLPLVRAANSGISAIIDPYGRVRQQLPLDRTGVIDGELPAPLERKTIFAQFGNLPPAVIMLALLAHSALRSRRRIRSPVPRDEDRLWSPPLP